MHTPRPDPAASASGATTWPHRVAVVGAGTMGVGFAQLLALAGIPCALADASADAASAARSRAVESAKVHAEAGLMPPDAAARIEGLVTSAAGIPDAVHDVDVVFEAVPEDPVLKGVVLAAVEAAAPAGCVIATNTSAIPIAKLAAELERPARFLGAHWFNPPQWVPCVELIAGPSTAEEHVSRVRDLLTRLGKVPLVVGDGPGFVGNRIQFAMFKEACAIVQEGLSSAEVVDEVVRASFGFRLPFFGPFAIADMAGLDVYAGAYAALQAGLGERLSVPPVVAELVAAGRLGTKTGGGFLSLSEEDAVAMVRWRDAAYVGLSGLLDELGPVEEHGA